MDTIKQIGMVIGAGGAIGHAVLNAMRSKNEALNLVATHRRLVHPVDAGISWAQLDYDNAQGLAAGAVRAAADLERLDYLVFASGLLHADSVAPEKKLGHWEAEQFQRVMWVNAGAPLTVFAALQPKLANSMAPKVMFLSAQIGSIGDNRTGGWYSYRMAKAALNMGVRTAAIEAARWGNQASVVAVHPGTTKSQLTKPYTRLRKDINSAEQTGAQLVELLVSLKPEQSGLFMSRDGVELPW